MRGNAEKPHWWICAWSEICRIWNKFSVPDRPSVARFEACSGDAGSSDRPRTWNGERLVEVPAPWNMEQECSSRPGDRPRRGQGQLSCRGHEHSVPLGRTLTFYPDTRRPPSFGLDADVDDCSWYGALFRSFIPYMKRR